MVIYLKGQTLPKYNIFKELPTSNVAQNTTLDGTLYVDIINRRRSWLIHWDQMLATDYTAVRAIYDSQFSNSQPFTPFYVPDLGVNVFVFVTINERNMRYNNTIIENFEITLEEQSAIS